MTVEEVRRRLPIAIQRIRTDHGSEFGTDFTWHLRDLGVSHRQILRGCPQSNGKVERSHRTDANEFYRRMIFRSPAELAQKLRQWDYEYNHRRPTRRFGATRQPNACASFESHATLFNNQLEHHTRVFTLKTPPGWRGARSGSCARQ